MTGKKNKEIGSATSFQCPMLNNSNFNIWAIRMQVILEAHDVWEVVELQTTTQIDNKADKTAIAFIFQALPEDEILQVAKHKSARTVWDALKTRHVGENRVQQAKQQTLKAKFEALQMKRNESVDSFISKISSIISRATNVGLTFEDSTLVRKLLTAVPNRYLHIVASIEQYSNLDNMSLDEAIGRLKTFDERLKCKKERQPDRKHVRTPFSQQAKYKSTTALDLIYGDLCGPISPPTPSGKRYIFLLVDDYSRYMWEYFLNSKDQAFGVFKEFKTRAEKEHGTKIKTFRTDRGGEFTANEFHNRDAKFKEDKTWNWKEYVKDFDPKEPEWSDFIIQNNKTQEMGEVQQDQENEIKDDVFTDNENEETPTPTNSPPNTPSTISHSDTFEYSPIQSINFSPNFQTSTPLTTDTNIDHIPTREYRTLNEIESMQVEIDSINKHNTWKLTTLPKDHKAIGLKWVFKTKKDANGEILKYKARLVAKGFIQEHGIDFDEVFAPVARIETIRLILALATYNKWEVHYLDVKSAFLHGDLKEEVYVSQANGFIKTKDKRNVYRLRKALYGLKQAPRAWYTKLDKTLKLLNFNKCALEQAKEIESFKYQMQEQFEISVLGLLAYYLGIEVTQKWGEISIKQTGNATKILKDTGMLDCNDAKILMEPGLKLTKLSKEMFVDPPKYQSIIGCLRYLLHTRPDLSFPVRLLSRFMQEPQEQHMKAIKQVLGYIKGTKDYGITYEHDGNKIQGYSDSSYCVNTHEGKGTTRIVFYFGNSPITWSTQKQGTVTLSSSESKFIAATEAATQALWLKRLLSKITNSNEEKITIYVDNKSTIILMKNPIFHGRSKHIDTKYHFIRE
nr:ribonuclease H-like domain, reverse transcriptase, RNA-dependent DNA polymerase [Tanacetum cinerariifolium]